MERMGRIRGERPVMSIAILAAGLLLAVAGCAPADRDAVPSASEGTTPTPLTTPSAPEPEASEPDDSEPDASGSGLEGVPLRLACPALLDPQTVYDYNPNVGVDPQYLPTPAADRARRWGGVACGLLNQTSGEQYSFAVARFTPGTAAQAPDEIAVGTSVAAGLPGTAYFRTAGDTGRIDVFVDDYWVVAESVAFFEARDAAGLIEGIVDALP